MAIPGVTNFAGLAGGAQPASLLDTSFDAVQTYVDGKSANLGNAVCTTLNGITFTTSTGTFTLANGKTLTWSNTGTVTGTDGFTLNVGAGGTLGTAAYTAATSYAPAAGSASITTVGTVTAGTWNAGVISPVYGGTGVANNVANTVTYSGSFGITYTLTGPTAITFPTSGTLVTTANNLSVFASTTSAQLAGVISDETGSGSLVFATSPTLVTPTLGVATATSVNKVAITAPASSATLTLADGSTLATSGANSLTLTTSGATNITLPTTGTLTTTANNLSVFAATTSAQLAGIISNETGSGSLVFATSPTLVTPVLGAATATSVNGITFTSSTGVFSLTNGKTLTWTNTGTVSGTDNFTLDVGTGGTLGTAAYTAASAYATLSFTTIAVSGQSNVVADSTADTLTLVAGTGITLTTNAATDTITITSSVTAAPSFKPGMSTGRYYSYPFVATTAGNTYTADRLYGMPIFIGTSVTLTKIGLATTTGNAGNARLGIYNMGTDGLPSTLLLDAGTVTTTAIAEKEITISQAVTAGWYYLGVVFDAGGAASNTRGISTANNGSFVLGGSTAANIGTSFGPYVGLTYGALPTPFGTPTFLDMVGGNFPALWVRL